MINSKGWRIRNSHLSGDNFNYVYFGGLPYDWKEGNMLLEENPLDRHVHLHIHEIIPERWLLPKRKTRGLFLGMFCGALVSIAIIGVLWIELWR